MRCLPRLTAAPRAVKYPDKKQLPVTANHFLFQGQLRQTAGRPLISAAKTSFRPAPLRRPAPHRWLPTLRSEPGLWFCSFSSDSLHPPHLPWQLWWMWNREADIRFLHRETLDRQQRCSLWDLQAFKYISKLLELCRVAGRENQENHDAFKERLRSKFCCLRCACMCAWNGESGIQREAGCMREWVRPLFQKIWPEPRTSWMCLCNSAPVGIKASPSNPRPRLFPETHQRFRFQSPRALLALPQTGVIWFSYIS